MRALVVLGVVGVTSPALAQDLEDARVVLARGEVSVRGASTTLVATPGMVVNQGDQVRTGHDGMVRLLLGGAAVVDLCADTSMVVTRAQSATGGSQTRIKVWSGRLWARVSKLFGNESKFEVESPNAVAGVRGTEFVVEVAPDGATEITVLDGAVAVTARDGGPERLLETGGRLSAKDTHSLVSSTTSENDRRLLRSTSTAGGHLSRDGAPLRFQGIAGQLPQGGSGHGTEHVGPHVQLPPIDLDPAAGRTRIHGTIQIKD